MVSVFRSGLTSQHLVSYQFTRQMLKLEATKSFVRTGQFRLSGCHRRSKGQLSMFEAGWIANESGVEAEQAIPADRGERRRSR